MAASHPGFQGSVGLSVANIGEGVRYSALIFTPFSFCFILCVAWQQHFLDHFDSCVLDSLTFCQVDTYARLRKKEAAAIVFSL